MIWQFLVLATLGIPEPEVEFARIRHLLSGTNLAVAVIVTYWPALLAGVLCALKFSGSYQTQRGGELNVVRAWDFGPIALLTWGLLSLLPLFRDSPLRPSPIWGAFIVVLAALLVLSIPLGVGAVRGTAFLRRDSCVACAFSVLSVIGVWAMVLFFSTPFLARWF